MSSSLMGKPAEQGCIPSKARVERKEKLRMKQVKFRRPGQQNGEARKSRGRLNVRVNALSSKLNLMKSKENICSNEANSSSSDDEFEMGDDWVLSYEPVKQVEVELPRPIVIFGPSKEKMSDELIKIDPTKYQQGAFLLYGSACSSYFSDPTYDETEKKLRSGRPRLLFYFKG